MNRYKILLVAIASLSLMSGGRVYAQIINGDFGTGDFTGWTRSAFFNSQGGPATGGPNYATFLAAQSAGTTAADTNAVVSQQTTSFDGNSPSFSIPVVPDQGNYLAFLSDETSAGDGTLTGSSISQTFMVDPNVTSITFGATLLNNDDPSDFSFFNDFGGVALSQGNTILQQFNLDLDPTSSTDGHVFADAATNGYATGGFLNTTNNTTWIQHSFDVSNLGGQAVTLTAYVTNYGQDNSTETRLLLENFQPSVTPPPAVPETSDLSMLTVGGFFALAYTIVCRGRRRLPIDQL